MPKLNLLNKLTAELCEAIPTHLKSLKKDFQKNCERILKHTFDKLDLVTREEFEVQSKVLLRTRKKLEDLEEYIKALEKAIAAKKRPQ